MEHRVERAGRPLADARSWRPALEVAVLRRPDRLLIESELPIAAVAAESGSRSLANFNRRFRELRATTPRAYRAAFTQAGPGGFQLARKQESRPGIPERTAA